MHLASLQCLPPALSSLVLSQVSSRAGMLVERWERLDFLGGAAGVSGDCAGAFLLGAPRVELALLRLAGVVLLRGRFGSQSSCSFCLATAGGGARPAEKSMAKAKGFWSTLKLRYGSQELSSGP